MIQMFDNIEHLGHFFKPMKFPYGLGDELNKKLGGGFIFFKICSPRTLGKIPILIDMLFKRVETTPYIGLHLGHFRLDP